MSATRGEVNPETGKVYDQLCLSYRGIDDFRMKLLGLLPLATSAIFVLVNNKAAPTTEYLPAVGVFGFIVTVGLFAYELHGIKKCGRLIHIGKHLERDLGVYGQFLSRPDSAAIFDEPFAASVIYPATLAVWPFWPLRRQTG